jgi:hypothetical protein
MMALFLVTSLDMRLWAGGHSPEKTFSDPVFSKKLANETTLYSWPLNEQALNSINAISKLAAIGSDKPPLSLVIAYLKTGTQISIIDYASGVTRTRAKSDCGQKSNALDEIVHAFVNGKEDEIKIERNGERNFLKVKAKILGEGVKEGWIKADPTLQFNLSDISFEGPNLIDLNSDGNGVSGIPVKYSAPHWVSGFLKTKERRNYPVAFLSGSQVFISANFMLDGLNEKGTIYVRAKVKGENENGLDLSVPESPLKKVNGLWLLEKTSIVQQLPKCIGYYRFSLTWEAKISENEWKVIATSENHEICVTLNSPLAYTPDSDKESSVPNTKDRPETLFWLGCKLAHGENDEEGAVKKIYEEFKEKKITRKDGEPLFYRKRDMEMGHTTAYLLRNKNGTCQAWAGLFRDTLLLQGIKADRMVVKPKKPELGLISIADFFAAFFYGGSWEMVFFVKEWEYPQSLDKKNGFTVLDKSIMKPGIGKPGQNNDNPKSIFTKHFITECRGIYYDPSYGTDPISGPTRDKDYEDRSFAAYGFRLKRNFGQKSQCFSKILINSTSKESESEVDIKVFNEDPLDSPLHGDGLNDE